MSTKFFSIDIPVMYLDFLHAKAANCAEYWEDQGKPDKAAYWNKVSDEELIIYCLARFSEVLANE